MSLAKIIWAVSALAAVIFAFVNGFELEGTILAVLGLLAGWFLDHDHRRGVIIAAAFLLVGGATALGSVPGIGAHLTAILTSLAAVFSAASVMAIIKTLVERITQSNAASKTS